MPQGIKSVDNHALYVNIMGSRKTCPRGDLKPDRVNVWVTQAQITNKGKHATNMNIVLSKTEVFRRKEADTVDEIENRLYEWTGYVEEVGEAPQRDDQRKPLLISILLVSILEHMLNSVAMRDNDDGSYEELEQELLECFMVD